MVRVLGRGCLETDGPGLEAGGISQEDPNSLRCFHLEVIVGDPGRIDAAFIPTVQDFLNFNPPAPIIKCPGGFFPLVAGIRLNGGFLKNPFFFHFILTTENTEKILIKKLKLKI